LRVCRTRPPSFPSQLVRDSGSRRYTGINQLRFQSVERSRLVRSSALGSRRPRRDRQGFEQLPKKVVNSMARVPESMMGIDTAGWAASFLLLPGNGKVLRPSRTSRSSPRFPAAIWSGKCQTRHLGLTDVEQAHPNGLP
jgi:hypothetical protein